MPRGSPGFFPADTAHDRVASCHLCRCTVTLGGGSSDSRFMDERGLCRPRAAREPPLSPATQASAAPGSKPLLHGT